jgi:hypothetical protein
MATSRSPKKKIIITKNIINMSLTKCFLGKNLFVILINRLLKLDTLMIFHDDNVCQLNQ